jgi:hypothetical protein
MRVYHRTDQADAIERDGFRDGEGTYMTTNVYRGVWVSAPWPLDENEGACGDVVFELEIPESLSSSTSGSRTGRAIARR